jgi:hypothetical protein
MPIPEAPPQESRPAEAKAAIVLCTVALASYACLLGSPAFVQWVAGREMLVEVLGALAFLTGALFYFLAWRWAKDRGEGWSLGLLGCALLLFLAFGEEASWGQHWLGFATPEPLREINAQQETNLHNLWLIDSYRADGGKKAGLAAVLLNSNRLFDLLVIGFFLILPLAARGPRWLRRPLDRVGVPAAPLALCLPLLLNWGLTALAELTVVGHSSLGHLAVSELREFNYAMLFLAAAFLVWRGNASSLHRTVAI